MKAFLLKRLKVKPTHLGLLFLEWLITGIDDRSIDYNNPNARVHVVNDGVLLVSPGIFKDFVAEVSSDEAWEDVQKKFCKLFLHKKTVGGLNVHKYRISGHHQSGMLMGLVVMDTSLIFRKAKPKANPHIGDF